MTTMHVIGRFAGRVETGLRPFDIARDLRPVAELISRAFAHELDPRGTAALREMRMMGYMGGFLKLLNRSTGEFDDVFSGYVWVEENKVVGNVTVQRADRYGNRWQIANVAVAPAFRGRGIARRLMQAALEHVEECGGHWAVLQVYADNTIARRLYERLSFENMGGNTEMQIQRVPTVSAPAKIPNFRSFSASHGQALYDLVNNQSSAHIKWWRAIRRSDFQISFEQQLSEWFWRTLGRSRVYRRSIQRSHRMEAALILSAQRWQGEHQIQMWVRPENYTFYEASLIQWALAMLTDYPRWPITISLNTEHAAAVEVLEQYGFEQKHTLLTMRRKIKD